MSNQKSSKDIRSITFSPGSEAGASPCVAQDGQTIDVFSPEAHHANHSALQDAERGMKTSGTLPQSGSTWSQPSGLLGSLVSRLQPQLKKTTGSMIYSMHWKQKATPRGRSYYQLVASARRTSVNASGSLPTPSGTSNGGKNHVAGRLDEWGGSSNPFRGTDFGKVHCPSFELWMMGYPEEWAHAMPPETRSSRRSRRKS